MQSFKVGYNLSGLLWIQEGAGKPVQEGVGAARPRFLLVGTLLRTKSEIIFATVNYS